MEGNAKKLIFNKSTLLSLKAELIRKQEEVQQRKLTHSEDLKNFRPLLAPKKENNKEKSFIKEIAEVDPDEIENNKKVREKLERKARLYESLTEDPQASKYSSNFLVQFDMKEKQDNIKEKKIEEEIGPAPCISEAVDYADNDWVEYTDCFGRTKKCHKSDLEDFKQRDDTLKKKLSLEPEENIQETKLKRDDVPEFVEKTEEFLANMRQKWEEQERLLKEKDGDIHYQDLLFDEAREHGVGYFNFSTDEATRRKEQAELENIRKETQAAQKETASKRAEMEKSRTDRVKAAKARRRARLGLPPEEDEKEDLTSSILEFISEQKTISAQKAKEEADKLRNERELIRKKERENYVRDWDVGKEQEEGKKESKFRTLTQEEYLERERDKRIKEFAPPANSDLESNRRILDTKGHTLKLEIEKNAQTKTWDDVRPNISADTASIELDDSSLKGLYFSSNKSKNKVEPIINELEESVTFVRKKPRTLVGAEIAPPALFEYYTGDGCRKPLPSSSNMNDAFEQGMKVLEEKSSRKRKNNEVGFLF